MLLSLLEVCQEWRVLYGGTWRTLRVPDLTPEGQGNPWFHWWPCLTQRKIPWKFHVAIFIISVSRRGVLQGGTWRKMRVPDWADGGQVHPWCPGRHWWTPRVISWKFQVNIFICCEVIRDLGVNRQPPYCTVVERVEANVILVIDLAVAIATSLKYIITKVFPFMLYIKGNHQCIRAIVQPLSS